MAGDLVLITGATGHVGLAVLVHALKAGYQTRVAVRSEDRAKAVLEAPSIKALNPGSKLSFVTVPNITADGAYDEAVKGTKYVIHVASPLFKPSPRDASQYEEEYTKPAVQGSIRMLESARRAGTVERVVITSSLVAVLPVSALLQGGDEVYNSESRVPTPTESAKMDIEAYCFSKIAALNAAEEWMKQEKPSFDVIHIQPSYVIGKNELNTTTEGMLDSTNRVVLTPILGMDMPYAVSSGTVHLDDVAYVHVAALDPKISGNQSFITSTSSRYEDIAGMVKKLFPKAVADGTLPNNGSISTVDLKVDAAKAEKTFGFKHKSFEEQVKSVVEQYLEIVGKT